MIKLIVREVELGSFRHCRYFVFDLDDGKPFCYRSRTSHNAFFHGGVRNDRPRRNRSASHLYVMDFLDESFAQKWLDEDCDRTGIVPQHLDNIWDFYRVIGYDHRKKKWLS